MRLWLWLCVSLVVFSNIQQDYSDSKEEVESVSEEEDGEEHNQEHDGTSSSEVEEVGGTRSRRNLSS